MTTVLVIEDAPSIWNNIAETLEYEGFSVFQAENGRIGVQLAQTIAPNLIVCDIMMPELDGYGVLLELRSQYETSTIPFIFLTAKADRESTRLGMVSGADDYLTKPFTIAELLATVHAQLTKQETLKAQYEQTLDELRGNLVKVLPHELNTPLTGIMGYADLLKMDYDSLDKTDIGRMADQIILSSQRLYRVVENYLIYAQVEVYKRDPQAMATIATQRTDDPGTLIRDTIMQKTWRCGRSDDVTVYIEAAQVQVSHESLCKIVDELMDNALKFSEPGTPIEVVGEAKDGFYTLSIRDQGRGMKPAEISRIGAYMQFERTLYEQQGLGLGLIIAKSLTELHGGHLSIQSAPSEGTIVYVDLLLS